MAKDSFILYTEQKAVVDKLTDEQAGKLIKAIYEYEETGEIPELDSVLDLVFTPFKIALDKNDSKWEEIKQKRSEAGKIGAEKKKQKQAKEANANFAKQKKQKEAKQAVNVNDNVNVNVIKKKNNKKKITQPSLEEIENYIKEKQLKVNAKDFYEYFTEGNWIDSKGNEVKNWKLKLLTWDKFQKEGKPKQKSRVPYEQRQYDNLDFLYANKKEGG